MNIYLITFLILLLFVVVVVVLDIINKIRNKSKISGTTFLIQLSIPAMVIIVFIFIYYKHTDSQINSGDDYVEFTSEDDDLIQLKSEEYEMHRYDSVESDGLNDIIRKYRGNSPGHGNIKDVDYGNVRYYFYVLLNTEDVEYSRNWDVYYGNYNNIYDSDYESYIFINKDYSDNIFVVVVCEDYLTPYRIAGVEIYNNIENSEYENILYINTQSLNENVEDVKMMDGQYVGEWFYDYITSRKYGSGNIRIMLYNEDKSRVYYYASYDEDISMNIIRRYKSGFVGDLFYQFRNNEREVYILRYRDSIIEVPMFY